MRDTNTVKSEMNNSFCPKLYFFPTESMIEISFSFVFFFFATGLSILSKSGNLGEEASSIDSSSGEMVAGISAG